MISTSKPCVLERRLELRQTLSLLRLRDGFVGLERRDLLLDLFGRLGELLGLWVDAGHDHRFQFKENIALVLKYFDQLAPLMQEQDLRDIDANRQWSQQNADTHSIAGRTISAHRAIWRSTRPSRALGKGRGARR